MHFLRHKGVFGNKTWVLAFPLMKMACNTSEMFQNIFKTEFKNNFSLYLEDKQIMWTNFWDYICSTVFSFYFGGLAWSQPFFLLTWSFSGTMQKWVFFIIPNILQNLLSE